MPDEPRESQIVITYYPREGGLAEYSQGISITEPTLEAALRTEALAAWESVGLIELPMPDPPGEYAQLREGFVSAAKILHEHLINEGSFASHSEGDFSGCPQARCAYARAWAKRTLR